MSIADWTAIEDVIQAQVVAASGLPAARVIWYHQSADRPDSSFIGLEMLDAASSSPATPETSQRNNPASVLNDGAELITSAFNTVNFTVRVHLFTQTATGAGAARSRLLAIRAFLLGAESVTVALDAGNVVLLETSPVNALPTVLEVKIESRAMMDLHCATIDGYEETATYIQTLSAAGITLFKPDGTRVQPDPLPITVVQP